MFEASAAAGCATGAGDATRPSASGSKAKSESRAKRTSDLERRNGVGGVLGGFRGVRFAVEGAVVVPVDEGWDFLRKDLMVLWLG